MILNDIMLITGNFLPTPMRHKYGGGGDRELGGGICFEI